MNQQTTQNKHESLLAFKCVHETNYLPKVNQEADELFVFARWLQKQPSPQNLNEIARLYRVAAANDYYKAANNLQKLIATGVISSPDAPKETIDLVEKLVKLNIPSGYYAMGHYLEQGYGVVEDKEKALGYFRKAADMGNADAQYYVGQLIEPIDISPETSQKMWQCAADQGHAEAAANLGAYLQNKERYKEALVAFQLATSNGDSSVALLLEEAFKAPPKSMPVNYLNLERDEERVKRYSEIWNFLQNYDGRNPKVPDIDKIVPLPPAPLPAWDGTFQWEKEFKSAKAPEMPSETLIKKLAQAKGLDPLTGLPLAKSK